MHLDAPLATEADGKNRVCHVRQNTTQRRARAEAYGNDAQNENGDFRMSWHVASSKTSIDNTGPSMLLKAMFISAEARLK